MKKTDGWMPLYIADYVADTLRLNTEQHGAYILLIMDYWRSGGPDADDDTLATITKLPLAQWRKHAPKILPLFQVRDGKLWHKRIEAEREKASGVVAVRSEAGKSGAASKWGQSPDEAGDKTHGKTPAKTRSQRLAEARKKGTHTPAQWDALQFATGYRCVRCGTAADDLEGGSLCKDHIKPLYQGGDDSIENIQPMCRNCNSSKGPDDSDLRETSSPGWRERLAKRLANACQTPAPSPTTDNHGASLNPDGFSSHRAGEPAESQPPRTTAGEACLAMRQAGIADTVPSHPTLLALLDQGVSAAELQAAAHHAVSRRKGFAYALGVVEGRRQDAARMTTAAPQDGQPQPLSRFGQQTMAAAAEAERMLFGGK